MGEYVVSLVVDGTTQPQLVHVPKATSRNEALGIAMAETMARPIIDWAILDLPDRPMAQSDALDKILREACLKHINLNERIAAIKEVRSITGWGLKDAKRWVDDAYPNPAYRDSLRYLRSDTHGRTEGMI